MDYSTYYKTIFKIGLSLVSIIAAQKVFAQENANNVFGSNGLGEINNTTHPVYQGMGGTTAAQIDSIHINSFNPSSYANISKGQPIFSIGLDNTLQFSNQNGVAEKGSYLQINHFAFGISFAKRFGFSFGLRPYSRTAYKFAEREILSPSQTMKHEYQGKGSSNLFYGGFAVNVLNLPKHKVGIGANAGLVFGAIENTQTAYIDNGASVNGGTVYGNAYSVRSFYYDLGLNYQLKLDKDQVIVGATFTPSQRISATQIIEQAYTTNILDFDKYSYISSEQIAGSFTMPQTMAVGFQYLMNTRRKQASTKMNSRIAFAFEYKMSNWENYRENYPTNTTETYSNTSTIAVGVEYIPQQLFLERVSTGYLSKVRYRIGGSFSNLPYQINGNEISRQTGTIGFGFPFLMQRSISSINFSVSYSAQQATQIQTYKEQFVTFSLGVSFAPSINDRWFRKYKID